MAAAPAHAQDEVLSISPSAAKQLRRMLKGKRIHAILVDGTNLDGRVKKVKDGRVLVEIRDSKELEDIPIERFSTFHFTRYRGAWRAILTPIFSFGGLLLALTVIGDCEGCENGEMGVLGAIWAGMSVLGYGLGLIKDKKAVKLVIEQAGTPAEAVPELNYEH